MLARLSFTFLKSSLTISSSCCIRLSSSVFTCCKCLRKSCSNNSDTFLFVYFNESHLLIEKFEMIRKEKGFLYLHI